MMRGFCARGLCPEGVVSERVLSEGFFVRGPLLLYVYAPVNGLAPEIQCSRNGNNNNICIIIVDIIHICLFFITMSSP